MSAAGRVAVLKGGPSLERHVSLRSVAHAQEALERLGHEVLGLDVGPDLVPVLRAERPDVAFIALHGGDGEEGTLQALLEAIGVPYTGSGPAACARCTDKALAKHLMREAGIPTPDFHFLREESIKQLGAAAAVEDIEDRLGLPLVVKPARQGSALGVKFALFDEVLKSADVVTLHTPLTSVTQNMISDRQLALMKPTAILVNTCRGPVVDERALHKALITRRIAGAGLDVMVDEPPSKDNPLLNVDTCTITPHTAGPTWENWPKAFRNAFDNILRVHAGRPPLWVVPELRDLVR